MRIDEYAAAYKASTEVFLDLADSVTAEQLDICEVEGWSARQIIHHMADSEAQSYARLRRLIAEPEGSVIQGYDEAAWADCITLGYRDLAIDNAIAVIRSVRAASLDVIVRLEEADLHRFGMHSESGVYTVRDWLQTYVAHPRDHAAQMQLAVGT